LSVWHKPCFLLSLGREKKKAQQPRHKLESWKQAFRLDKKLQYKLEREQTSESGNGKREPVRAEKPEKPKPAKANSKSKPKSRASPAENNGPVNPLARLSSPGHE